MLPSVTEPIRFNDLPTLLGPYARTAPVYVYLMSCGNVKATRFPLPGDDEELMLVLRPRGMDAAIYSPEAATA